MSPRAISFRILRFHNCEGCVRKVGVALHQIDGVELVEFDPASGNVTVSTSKHPEVIRYAIERKTKKNVIILSQEINPRTQNPNFTGPHQGTINVQELAETLLRVSHAEGLNNVELVGDLNSNSFRLNFNQRLPDVNSVYTGDADYEFLFPPPRTIREPSRPQVLFPETSDQGQVYGYPPEFYGSCTTCSHDHQNRCCAIL
ncbi:putative heavy metal-associated domain, HMA, heavy metal-associated domain superfamily [Helianthus annuus]|nr:putative heavy metal-associated domain, HMA, heavy metal-associated domain superfamily [Helianthus annuus]